jgi:hypothetical protein
LRGSKSSPRGLPGPVPIGGGKRVRTADLLLAKQALSQLSYAPVLSVPVWPLPPDVLVGLGRFELPTSRLSGVRSNQLSYRPAPAGWRTREEPSRRKLDSRCSLKTEQRAA